MSELMNSVKKLKLIHRCDALGNKKEEGGYFIFAINVYSPKDNSQKEQQLIVPEIMLDDFAMNVMAEVDGAKG